MAQIQQLTTSDYTILEHQDQNKTRNLVISTIKEPAVVLYYSTTCPHCRIFMPIFEQIATNVPRVKFCVLNAEKYKNVAIDSLTTTTPIKSVPHIIAYNNGKSAYVYTGPKKYNDFLDFLAKWTETLDKTKFGGTGGAKQGPFKEELSSYRTDLGIPYNVVCEAGQCYLTSDQINATDSESANFIPDTCYLTQEQCYGSDCKIENENRISNRLGASAGRSAKDIVDSIHL
jgi:thioredoxin-like negative regulator of GroEL